MTALLAEPQTATHAGTPGDIHLVCEQHDPDRLLCGLDLADAPWNKSADLADAWSRGCGGSAVRVHVRGRCDVTVAAIRPPFAYYGGKTNIADRIVAMLPPHEHYVKPFAGSLAVLLAKSRRRWRPPTTSTATSCTSGGSSATVPANCCALVH